MIRLICLVGIAVLLCGAALASVDTVEAGYRYRAAHDGSYRSYHGARARGHVVYARGRCAGGVCR